MNKIKLYRKRAGLSQEQLAILSNVPLSTVRKYELGKTDITHAAVGSVYRLSMVFNCSIEDLLGPEQKAKEFSLVRENMIADLISTAINNPEVVESDQFIDFIMLRYRQYGRPMAENLHKAVLERLRHGEDIKDEKEQRKSAEAKAAES